ncbi:MAG TPA: SCO family protein [Thermoanaerobaculia bacterium]|jgi:protein SCO1/2|nr:SCO family protein [Thermoanaerobaculia bacterium]
MKIPLRRGLLWAFLVAVLLAVAVATLIQWLRQPDPLPVYGKLPAFSLVNRDGRTIRLEDMAGAPWVADFIFTRCPASCPMMSARMARLDHGLPRELDVLLVSISVDPAYDTPEVLERYAKKFKAPERWLFLTGEREDVRRLSIEGFKLGLDMDPPPGMPGMAGPEPILHSTRFVLVDGEGQIRGYYEAFDEASTEKLRRDLLRLAKPLS